MEKSSGNNDLERVNKDKLFNEFISALVDAAGGGYEIAMSVLNSKGEKSAVQILLDSYADVKIKLNASYKAYINILNQKGTS